MVGRMGVGQMGFAEAFLGGKAGQNRRLERIERLIDPWQLHTGTCEVTLACECSVRLH